jgi:hypothetical protein
MPSGRQLRATWLETLMCGMAFASNVLRADAIVPYDSPGPLGMQVTALLNAVNSTLESYCPARGGPPQCMELKRMRRALKAAADVPLREMRAREQAIEAELEHQRWERAILAQ